MVKSTKINNKMNTYLALCFLGHHYRNNLGAKVVVLFHEIYVTLHNVQQPNCSQKLHIQFVRRFIQCKIRYGFFDRRFWYWYLVLGRFKCSLEFTQMNHCQSTNHLNHLIQSYCHLHQFLPLDCYPNLQKNCDSVTIFDGYFS